MDHGTFSRLGETGKNHQANVRIVGATTEDPNSTLLDTLLGEFRSISNCRF